MEESIDALRKSRIGRRRGSLYFLPWYAIIGSPACGKSTAIKNSVCTSPWGAQARRKRGHTQLRLWFAEEAIILDTAGRYTFNDDNEPDRDEWLAFLKLLRRIDRLPPEWPHRRGLCDGLLTKDRDEIMDDARNIRQKSDQIVRELGIQFPIYLLVTKCDLIEGFTDFFGRLPKRRLDEMPGGESIMGDGRPTESRGATRSPRSAPGCSMRTSFLWGGGEPGRSPSDLPLSRRDASLRSQRRRVL